MFEFDEFDEIPFRESLFRETLKINPKTEWRTSDGRVLKISEMTDEHLSNAIDFRKRSGRDKGVGFKALLKEQKLRMKKSKSEIKFVAVVCKLDRPSKLEFGSWVCFIGKTQQEAADKAMDANAKWGGRYTILLGKINGQLRPYYRQVSL